MPAPPRLTLRLFGGAAIQVGSTPLELGHRKARALLCYLAVTGQRHTRAHLTNLLWSETSDREASHSLRSALYRLRQALRPGGAEDVLLAHGDTLQLQLDEVRDTCDVARFRLLAAAGSEAALTEAASLYRGPLLHGMAMSGVPVFEEWLQAEDARLGQRYANVLERLARLAEARADSPAVLRLAETLVRFEPLSESGHQLLIAAHLQQGALGSALRLYQQFESRLRQELGVPPPQRLQALVQAARRSAAGGARAKPPARVHPQTLPFVGREQLLNQLTSLGQAAGSGRGVAVLLQGEGGIGKSRVLDELAGQLTASRDEPEPWTVLRGTCSPFDQLLSYGPFLEALGSLGGGELEGGDPLAGTPDARGRYYWQVLEALRALAQGGPVLLALDDLQWANSSTLNLFGFLATHLHDVPMLLVGTVQRAEAVPALQRLITLGRRRGELHLYSLRPLSLEAITLLLQTTEVAPDAVSNLAGWLHERSGGNPFLLKEIYAQLRADAVLVEAGPAGAGWRLDPARWLRWRATFKLPETTHDLVTWRLENLAAEARRLLEVLAVAGQPLALELLQDLLGYRQDALLSLSEDLLTRGLLTEAGAGYVALAHNLLRETLLHRLSQLRRRSLHRQLAERLEARPALARDFPLWQIALHAVAGEDVERARRYGLRVLAELPQHDTGAETVEFLQHLHDLLAPVALPSELLPLTRGLGQVYQSLGQLDTAAGWLRSSLHLARQVDDRLGQAAALFELGELALVTNDFQKAAAVAQEGLAAMGAGAGREWTATQARGHRLLGAALAMEGRDLPAAEQQLQAAVAAHRSVGGPSELAAALFELGNVAAQRGEVARALNFYTEAAQAARDGRVHYYQALAHNNYAYHSLLLGQPTAAQAAVAQGLQLAEQYEMVGVLLFLYSTQGEIHLYLAQWEAATRVYQQGLAVAEELGSLERQAGCRAGLALAARGGGRDLPTVAALLEDAIALIGDQGYWHLQTRLYLWLAQTLADAGQPDRAWPHLERALAASAQHGRGLLGVQAKRLRACLSAAGDWPAAQMLFEATLSEAAGLGLALEIARTEAAWGACGLRADPPEPEALQRLARARATFVACGAAADLAALPAP
jgi:DNA-binding SARP family transcriptional activator/predicted ATPase